MAKEASGIAKAGLTTGIIGTTLGALNNNGCGNGILANLFGNNCGCAGRTAGAMAGAELQYVSQLQAENAMLKSENYADKNSKEVYQQTLADNKSLRDEVFVYLKNLSDEAANNRVKVATLEVAAEKDKEIMQLKIDKCCCEMNGKIEKVASDAACGINQLAQALQNVQNTLNGIVKVNVDKNAICPEVMLRYNSWTAPTTTAPAA